MGASAWRRRDDRRRDTFARIGVMFLVVVLTAALVAPAGARSAFEGAVALIPQTPRGVGNCIPFANNTSFGFSGFIYRDVPSFRLEPGTRFAFDLGGLNDRDVRRNISFAVGSRNPSPANGGVRALGWTQVVSDTQLPLNPRGNAIVGDYELEYTSEASFDFPGGGLVVGFGASPPGAYADTGCEQVLVHTDSNDPSGHFYARFWGKPDRTLNVLDSGDWDMRWLGGLVIYSDSSPPVTTASVDPPPDADGWADPPVTVTLEATDDSGVAEVHYQVGDGDEVTVAGHTAELVLDEPGVHDVRFWAVDTVGNVEDEQVLVVRVSWIVAVDAMPGNPVNPWNARRGGALPVLVPETDGFDPLRLEEVRFSGAEPQRCSAKGPDLSCLTQADAFGAGTVELTAWLGGIKVKGRDVLVVVGP